MKRVSSVTLFVSLLFSALHTIKGQEFAVAGSGNSQIFRAYRASSIVVGEVVYVGNPSRDRFGLGSQGTQAVVYKVLDVVKGNLRDEMINVAVEVSLTRAGNLASFIGPGQKHIILLGRKFESSCSDTVLNRRTQQYIPNPHFDKFSKLSCYQVEADSVIDANADEIKAISVFGRDDSPSGK